MSEQRTAPPAARVAVIGAGIVGNCLVEHLARLGWEDIVLLDKGPLPDPGGSTGHASNFIFPTDHGREIALITLESQRQYEALGANTTCGGIEVARTEERMEELRRRMTSARVWGIESELLTPAEVAAKVPFVNADVILGGFHTPSVSVVDSVGAGTIMRERALARGVLTVLDETEVTGIEVEPARFGRPRVRAVATTRGTIEVDHAVIACGVWSPRIAAMAGATIPLTPAVHQMADFGPVEILLGTGNEIGYPIVRDMDSFMYERQSDGAMEVGSYAHRPILMRPDDIPSVAEAERSPTELPFTPRDFAPQLERAREIMGGLLAGTEMQYSVNGLLSLTPDTQQLLGETAEVANLWSAAAVWVREGPGSARLIAEWMTHGYPRLLDPHESDVTRFQPHERTGTSRPDALPRALPQDVRDRASARAMGVRARREPVALPPPDRGAGGGVLRGPGMGAPAVVRVERGSSGPPRRPGPPARVGPPLVVAHHQRGAPAPAREGRRGGPGRVPDLRRVGARRRPVSRGPDGQRVRPAGRKLDLHAVADAGRGLSRRPDHSEARARPVPHRLRGVRRSA